MVLNQVLTRAGLVAATAVPFVAAHPRVAELVVTDNTSYCPLQRNWGLLCPGCGMTHAMIELAHGSIEAATRSNALVWLYLALVLIGWLAVFRVRLPGRQAVEANFGWILLSTVAAFTVLRNF